MHQPQNEGGELGLKFGGMLPYMVAAGSKIPSAIIGALTGAAGSEAGKHIAEGTPYEGTAEIAGGVVGPYAATKTAELGLKGLGKIVGGITSGAGENVPQQAFQAGVAGGKPWETFTQNMRKQVPREEIVNQANGAIDNLIRSKNANYEEGVAKLDQTPHFVGFSGAEKGLADTADIGNIRGVVTNQGAQSARDEITSLVNKWKGMSQPSGNTGRR